MAKLAISTDFLGTYHKLEPRTRQRIIALAQTFAKHTSNELLKMGSVNLETHNNQRDPRARTVRINSNYRGIVCAAGSETFILTMIVPHDDSDRWMANNRFEVNPATGALEIVDVAAVEAAVNEIGDLVAEAGLFEHRKDKDFIQLGINEGLLPVLRAFSSEEELEALLPVLPDGQQLALTGLVDPAETVESIYSQIAGDIEADEIDVEDIAAAVAAPASRANFHVFTDEDELALMLNEPLSTWRVYLHHTQEKYAYRPVYNGPARVTGGAGTGKTIVGVHRARFLADQLTDRSRRSILFTTFTRNLSEAIERQLTSLAGSDVLEVVEVNNVDAIASTIVKQAEGIAPSIITGDDVMSLWQTVVNELQIDFSPEFLNHEWEQVVLAQGIDNRADYFTASRAGRGVRLDRRARADVWKGVEAFLAELSRLGKRTFLQLSIAAAGHLENRTVKPYDHVIVDEGQDLHEAQWRMLRAAVAEGENDMFIVGDSHQRIYDRRSSLSKVGINIRGRSHKLRINYRTTRQILRWAMALLGEETYDDLDDGEDKQTISNYHSHLEGPPPTIVGASSAKEQLDTLVAQIQLWINDGLEPEAIGVIARTSSELDAVRAALSSADITNVQMTQDIPKADGVRLGSMHRMKGLEFIAVAVMNVDDDRVPLSWTLTDKSADEVQHRVDLMRERCLLYVACTRARDHLWVGWSGKPSRFLGPMLGE